MHKNKSSIHLRSQKMRIIEQWKKSAEKDVPAAQEMTQSALIDSLPEFLDRMADILYESNLGPVPVVKKVSHEHAQHRIVSGKYSIEQIIREYQLLRETLFKVLEEEIQLLPLERDVILKTIDMGINEAATEYMKLKTAAEAGNLAAVQVALDCIISMDSHGKVTEFNPAAEKTFGFTRSEALGKELAELIIPPELRDRHRRGLERYLATGVSHYMGKRLQFPAIKKDGGQILVELAITEIPGSRPPLFTGFLRDITDQILGETKIREQTELMNAEKEKFEKLFSESPAAMALLRGPDHIFEKSNNLYQKMIGNREVIGKPVLEALPEVRNEPYLDILNTVYNTGIPYYGKESLIHLRTSPDGPLEEKYLDFTYLRINDSKGKPYGVFAHAVDVTEKVLSRIRLSQANEALRDSEKQLRTFIEAMPQMAFIADAKGNITYFNQRFYDYVGMEKEMGGWGWTEKSIHHPEDLERTVRTWTESIQTGQLYQIEYRLRRYDGEYRWHLGRALPLRNDHGQIIKWFGTNTDIEDQKRVVAELEQERAIREQFVATLTHDLRNPLSAIKTSAEMIIRTPDKAEIRERAMSRIISAVDRSDSMIRNLLDANLIQAGKKLPMHMQKCDLSAIAEEIIEEQKVIHGNRFILKTERPLYGFWSCEGIRRIIDNLVSNAVKYGAADRNITLTIASSSEQVDLSVHNFGPAIPVEEQKTLFQAFKRAKAVEGRDLRGWGLGLSLVKGIAETHEGKVSIESEESKGTTFRIVLPRNLRN